MKRSVTGQSFAECLLDMLRVSGRAAIISISSSLVQKHAFPEVLGSHMGNFCQFYEASR